MMKENGRRGEAEFFPPGDGESPQREERLHVGAFPSLMSGIIGEKAFGETPERESKDKR